MTSTAVTAVPATPLTSEAPHTLIALLVQEIIERRLLPGVTRNAIDRWVRYGLSDGSYVLHSNSGTIEVGDTVVLIHLDAPGVIRLATCKITHLAEQMTDTDTALLGGTLLIDQGNGCLLWYGEDERVLHYSQSEVSDLPISYRYIVMEVMDRELEGFVRCYYAMTNYLTAASPGS